MIASTRPARGEPLTLSVAASRYLVHLERVLERKPSTLQDYRCMVGRHLIPFFGDRPLERIGEEELCAYIAAKGEEELANKTVLNHLNFLQGLFRHAVKRGWAAENPVVRVDKPRTRPTRDIRYLTAEEVDCLLAAVPDDVLGAVERPLYMTAAMCGARQGELLALRWRDIDWSASVLRVRRTYSRGRFTDPKSYRANRAVPMARRVKLALRALLEGTAYADPDDLVFGHPETGRPYDPSRLRKRFSAAIERARLRRVCFRDLRHTFGTATASAGAPIRAIQAWMGHQSFQTTLIYADYAPDPSMGVLWAERAFSLPRGGEVP